MDFSKLYKQTENSIVNVVQLDSQNNILSTATGTIIDDGKKVLTCSHCCNSKVRNGIFNKTNSMFYKGNIIFDDSINDIAILEFPNTIGPSLKIVNSEMLEIGNEIFTIGFPYLVGSEKTLTTGNIAAFEQGLIKINSSVNNGNSGGPLLNLNGEIIGVVNAKLGSLSEFLKQVESKKSNIRIQLGTIDPIEVIQQMIREMRKNLNLGIGYAIPSKRISEITDIIKNIFDK